MSMDIDTLIDNVLSSAEFFSSLSQGLLSSGDGENTAHDSIKATTVDPPASALLTTLSELPMPAQSTLTQQADALRDRIRDLYAETFPEVLADLEDRAAVADALGAMIDGDLSGADYESDVAINRAKLDEDLRISSRQIREKWAAAGYPMAPGNMVRELSESYLFKFMAFHDQRMAILGKAIDSILPKYKAALVQAQDMAMSRRAEALDATARLIKAAARENARPGVEYAAVVKARTAMAEAVLAQYGAKRSFDELLLKAYLGNLENEMQINRYYTDAHTKEVANTVDLAVAHAEAAGREAKSLWGALNVINSASSASFE